MVERIKSKRLEPDDDPPRKAKPVSQSHDGTAIAELEKAMAIDPHALDEALIRQPDAFYRVSQRLALLISRRDAAKQDLQEIEAEADRDIRKAASRNEEKLSEVNIKSMIRLDRDVKEGERTLLDLNAAVNQWQALKEGFQQRSYVLKDLVNLHMASYFGDSGNSRAAGMAKERVAEDVRRARREGPAPYATRAQRNED